jgi:prevent-host-death family protein
MKQVGVYEAKTHLARLLDEVERGETITITRHGRPVAQLTPVGEKRRPVAEVIAEIRANRKGNRLDGLSVKELINEGRM